MALRTRSVYVSDRGQEFELSEMTASHLINAIAHHMKQVDVVDSCLSVFNNDLLRRRLNNLNDTISTLKLELSKRDPDEDEGDQPKRGYYD